MLSRGKIITKTDALITVICYIGLLAFHGYRYGDGDMTETLSYALWLNDPTLFPSDFYIQALVNHFVNPRLPFALILYPFVDNIDWACFLLHMFSTLLFLLGWVRVGRLYIKDDTLLILWLCSFLFLSYNINLGGNEAWYYYFVPSQLAKALGVWALFYYLQERWNALFLMLLPVTAVQPMVGAQLALIFGIVYVWQSSEQLKIDFRKSLGILVYGIVAGAWILGMYAYQGSGSESAGNMDYFRIMEVRMAHHFFPSYYPISSWIILSPLILAAWLLCRPYVQLFRFFTVSILGLICYTIAVEALEFPLALNFQWYKTTVWLKPLALLVLCSSISRIEPLPDLRRWYMPLLSAILIFSCLQLTSLITWRKFVPLNVPFISHETAEMQFARKAGTILPEQSCTIVPPHITAFRQYSRRSVFIDYKSSAHDHAYLEEAYRRRRILYGMDLKLRRSGTDLIFSGNDFYHQLTAEDFQQFSSEGATHVLVERSKVLDLPLTAQDSVFSIYQL
ncbi:MAG: hypothetical protein HKN87_15005 [Saprospiraceae bacterium]|nr:hypothetical protein [Saprospiraceae bacterium]